MVRNIHVYGKRTRTHLSNIKCTELNTKYVQLTAGTSTTLRAVITSRLYAFFARNCKSNRKTTCSENPSHLYKIGFSFKFASRN